ncbi:unnamed protein product [Lasius platythorax]|uniref:Lytic transglycosylase n=2 Tax=Lasius TaxID=488720 RepID=A0A0J7LB98_LASNI|nr:lytic transglycosylase [Lasius niger]
MDALELQAALVKLDPATTVTPIGTTMKLVPHHRVAFTVNIDDDDEGDMTLEDSARRDDAEKSPAETTTSVSRKTPGGLTASHHHQGGGQQMGVSKCGIAEVR